jgi:hypothetical protein
MDAIYGDALEVSGGGRSRWRRLGGGSGLRGRSLGGRAGSALLGREGHAEQERAERGWEETWQTHEWNIERDHPLYP